jgi:AcrR family transcriptional regulator
VPRGRKCEIEQHPKKDRIVKALVRGDKYREITERYGVSKAALSRYLRNKLLPQTAEAAYERGMKNGSLALDQVKEAIERINKMYRACDEYLEHPDKPGEYFLGPRAEEIVIAYIEVDKEGNRRKRTMSLQDALNRLEKAGKVPLGLRSKHADPRTLVLQTMSKAREQMEFMARVGGQIQDIVVNVAAIEQWAEIKLAILEAVEDVPDARSRIVAALKEIAGA